MVVCGRSWLRNHSFEPVGLGKRGIGERYCLVDMAGLHRGCGLLSLLLLTVTWQLAGAQDNYVAANVGKPMELTAPFLAVTPAAAEAPSSGPGPLITECASVFHGEVTSCLHSRQQRITLIQNFLP